MSLDSGRAGKLKLMQRSKIPPYMSEYIKYCYFFFITTDLIKRLLYLQCFIGLSHFCHYLPVCHLFLSALIKHAVNVCLFSVAVTAVTL